MHVRATRDIADELTRRGVPLSLGGSIDDPNDPVGRFGPAPVSP